MAISTRNRTHTMAANRYNNMNDLSISWADTGVPAADK
jgi:hypothetical protein